MTAIAIPKYSYSSILKDAAKIAWRVQDLIGDDVYEAALSASPNVWNLANPVPIRPELQVEV